MILGPFIISATFPNSTEFTTCLTRTKHTEQEWISSFSSLRTWSAHSKSMLHCGATMSHNGSSWVNKIENISHELLLSNAPLYPIVEKINGGMREKVRESKNLLALVRYILAVNPIFWYFSFLICLSWNFIFMFSTSSSKFLTKLLKCNKMLLK